MIFPVSVPYRGATFLNRQMTQLKQILNVSVPYRGATFLNNLRSYLKSMSFQFPSPIGELHFSIWILENHRDNKLHSFPSPIGELHFSICIKQRKTESINCFRPLSGSYISQSECKMYRRHKQFPSPIGELHFSIGVQGDFAYM